ncbi:MAG: hypothetical protein VX910_07720 [Candidatus Latescibacterota bacterium]|nr:hypothetical protein [Candidatus Latescibacterota bacterium]
MEAIGSSVGKEGYSLRTDLDLGGKVGFTDCVRFSEAYGRIVDSVNCVPVDLWSAQVHLEDTQVAFGM